MRCLRTRRPNRRGAVLIISAFTWMVVLGMAAFAFDIGYIAFVNAQLQNAADSSALAGAAQLMAPYVNWIYPGATSAQKSAALSAANANAPAAAKQFAAYNQAGNVANLVLKDGDITLGYLDKDLVSFSSSYPNLVFPNSVMVTVRRDDTANQRLPLFFGPIIGTPDVALRATARATCFSSVTDFKPGADGLILPVALSITDWLTFLNTTYSPATDKQPAAIYYPPTGGPPSIDTTKAQLQVYPTLGGPGDFGLLNIGPPISSASGFEPWITTGASASDMQYLHDSGQLALPSSGNGVHWIAGPGIKSTLQSDFALRLGQPVLIPLFDTFGGTGSNGWYNIVGFAGATISEADGRGSTNLTIAIQPYPTLDGSAFGGVPNLSDTTQGSGSSPPKFSFQPPRLTL